jgi:LPXTG-site transpeptidase (sortase) family protein
MRNQSYTPQGTGLIDRGGKRGRHSSFKLWSRLALSLFGIAGLLAGLLQAAVVQAAGELSITPITWNVIGLDSNNVSVGPDTFPVGVRVCNLTSSSQTVTSDFEWVGGGDKYTSGTYINLRTGSLGDYTGTNAKSLAASGSAGDCADFYYEVKVKRDANAYNNVRGYYITAEIPTIPGSQVSTPQPRELYIEHLISQSRNATTDVQLDSGSGFVSIPAGGTMNLVVGNSYDIKLIGFTATNGYEQIENYINFPNTIFKINSVATTYTAKPILPTDLWWASKVYADGCVWVNDPTSLNYRSCTATGKYGGDVTVTYNVTIISGGGTTGNLTNLIYDFSGSSYHYNSDFGATIRYYNVTDASISKSFSPKSIVPGGTSTLTFTLHNPGSVAINNLSFSDTLPANVVIADPNGLANTCGGSVTAEADTSLISLSSGSLGGNASCTISVNATSATVGNYTNTSGDLFVGTRDTGSYATDILVVSNSPLPPSSCSPATIIAQFDFGTAGAPTLTSTKVSDVSFATIVGVPVGTGTFNLDTSLGNPVSSYTGTYWQVVGTTTPPTPPNPATYYVVDVDTSNYNGVQINFQYYMTNGDWSKPSDDYIYVYSDADSTGPVTWINGQSTNAPGKGNWYSIAYTSPTTGYTRTRFFISAAGAKNNPQNSPLSIDNVVITGCPRPDPPVIAKSFDATSILTGSSTNLRFTITNPTTTTLNGIGFTDTLPGGLTVATSTTSNVCGAGSTLTTNAGAGTISLSGGTLAAGAYCTFAVSVTGVTAGLKNNSVQVYSSNGGTGNTAAASILVRSATYSMTFIKQVGPSAIGPWSNLLLVNTNDPVYYRFVIENTGDSSLTGVTATDNTVNIANCSWVDGDGNAFIDTDPSPTVFKFTLPAPDADEGHLAYCIYGSVSASSGLHQNTATASNDQTASKSDSAYYATTSLTIIKDAVPNDAQDFSYTGTGPSDYNFGGGFSLDDDADPTLPNSRTFTKLDPGTYTLTEGALPAGWSFSNLVCTDPDGGSSVNIGTRTATIDMDLGESITCTYTNTKLGSIVITKDSMPDDAQDFSYTGSGPSGYNFGGGFSLDDDSDATLPNTRTFSNLTPGSYTLTEGAVSGWNLTGLVCVDPDSGSSVDLGTRTATIDVDAGETVNCTYTNTKLLPDLQVDKANDTGGTGTVGVSFNWTFNVTNTDTGNAVFHNGDVILRDPLPATGASYGAPSAGSFTNITNSANISCSIDGSQVLTCVTSGADVTIGASTGAFTITLALTPTTTGSLANTATVDSGSVITESNEGNNTDSDTVTIGKASPTITTTLSGGGTVGIAISDTATLSGGYNPTGNVTFNLYGVTDGTCSGPVIYTSIDGTAPYASGNYTADAVGTYHWMAVYTGDSNNNGATSLCADEAMTTSKASPTISTTPSAGGVIGVALSDTATLSGGYNPTGDVIFRLYGTGDATCSGVPVYTITDGTAPYASGNYTSDAVGTYHWTAEYVGDENNDGTTSPCADEAVTMTKASPTLTTTATAGPATVGANISDVAHLSGGYGTLGGSVTFDIYAPGDTTCASSIMTLGPVAVSGAGGYNSGNYATDAVGTYRWIAHYSGDANNNSVDTACNDADESSVTQKANPTITTTASPTTGTVGVNIPAVGDSATLSGGYNPTGSVTFTLYSDDTCSTSVISGSGAIAGGVASWSTSWTPTAAGTYYWIASYAGDTNNNGYTTLCQAANEDIVISTALNPVIGVVKSSVTTEITGPGPVVYTFTVTNEGNQTLTGITVSDPSCDALPVYQSGDLNTDSKLDLTETWVYTCTRTVTQAEVDAGGNLSNTVTADSNESAPDTDSLDIPITLTPDLAIVKEVSTDGIVWDDNSVTLNQGDTVYFRVRVQNTGNTTLTNLILDDGIATCTLMRGADDPGNDDGIFETGETWVYTCSFAAASGTHINTATADTDETPLVSDSAQYIATSATGVIDGTVYNDANASTTLDAGESGLSGVTVNLYDGGGLVASTTTGPGGTYSFTALAAGNYTVEEIDPAGYVSTTANHVPVTLPLGGTQTVDFGDYQLPAALLASINGVVFHDVNYNGVQDAGDGVIGGVTIQLFDHLGVLKGSTTTAPDGSYSFTGLDAGTYTVHEIDPVGYFSTTLNDVDVTLTSGVNEKVDFGDALGSNVEIIDPALTKFGDPKDATVGSIIVFTITVGNNGADPAQNVVITDTKPDFLDIILITIDPDPGILLTITGNQIEMNFGTINSTDHYTITIVTRVNGLGKPPGGVNNVYLTTSSEELVIPNDFSSAALSITAPAALLPSTGFAPLRVTMLGPQSDPIGYSDYGDLWLEIPSLGVKMPIVGVPMSGDTWDISWLGTDAGYLQGTAFPTWVGNSVLTGHVYLPTGKPGPFVNVSQLAYGNQINVHAYGQKYVYEVREVLRVKPDDLSVLKHEEKSWVTLLTCQVYNWVNNSYRYRIAVRAVLVSISDE